MSLRPKHAKFVAEYLKDLNATQAAIRAGYSPKTARAQGSTLLTNPNIAAAVQAKTAKSFAHADLTAERVLEELRRLAFSDLRGLFDEAGNLVPIHKLTDEQAASLASVEVIIKNAKAGDNQTDTVHKIRVWDKPKALEMLAKRFGLLIERVQHEGGVELKWAPSS